MLYTSQECRIFPPSPLRIYVSDTAFSCCAFFEGLKIRHGDYPLEGGLVPRSSSVLVSGERSDVALNEHDPFVYFEKDLRMGSFPSLRDFCSPKRSVNLST